MDNLLFNDHIWLLDELGQTEKRSFDCSVLNNSGGHKTLQRKGYGSLDKECPSHPDDNYIRNTPGDA